MAFTKGDVKLNKEFNQLQLIKTIQKMKAAITILVQNNHLKINDIRDLYF